MIHPYSQFEVLKSRILLFKTGTVLNEKSLTIISLRFIFADRRIRQISRICLKTSKSKKNYRHEN